MRGLKILRKILWAWILPQYSEKKRKIYEASREYFSALKEAKTQDEIEKLGKRLAELEAEYSRKSGIYGMGSPAIYGESMEG